MYKLLLITLLLIVPAILSAQKVKIEKIHNSNLFQIEDGTLIKLAGVDAPGIDHPDSTLSAYAEEIVDFAKTALTNGRVNIEFIDTTYQTDSFRNVYLKRTNLFYTVDYNELFLKWGYGKFIDNVDSLNKDILLEAEQIARESKNGMWDIPGITKFDTLDICLTSIEPCFYIREEVKPPFVYDRGPGRIAAEIVLSPAIGLAAAYVGAGLSTVLLSASDKNSWGNALLGFYTGYVLGSSWGVYIIADGGNKDLSMGLSMAAGALGGIAAVSLYDYDFWNNLDSSLPFLAAPIITTMIYANLIAPFPGNSGNKETHPETENMPVTHKDIYNHSLIFKQEVVRINF